LKKKNYCKFGDIYNDLGVKVNKIKLYFKKSMISPELKIKKKKLDSK